MMRDMIVVSVATLMLGWIITTLFNKIPDKTKREDLEVTIASGSRDPKTMYAFLREKRKVQKAYVVVLFALLILIYLVFR